MNELSKRGFLRLGAGAGALGLLSGRPLQAQSKQLSFNTYGGVYAKAVADSFIRSYTKTTGNPARAVVDTPSAALAKIGATMPRPEYDLYIGLAADTLRAADMGLIEELSSADLPALKQLLPVAVEPWGNKAVSFSISVAGFLYDKRKIPNPPRTWQEFAERTAAGAYGRSVSVPSASQASLIETCIYPINAAFGGTIDKPDPGFKQLKAMTPYITSYYTDLSQVVNQMSNGEVAIAVYSSSRSWVYMNQNDWAGFQIPSKGGILQSSQVMKVKNSSPEAWKLMNAFIDREGAQGFAVAMNSMVPNRDVTYPGVMAERVAAQEDVVAAPVRDLVRATPALIERWNKEIGG